MTGAATAPPAGADPRRLRAAWGAHLATYDWTHYATLTLRQPFAPERLRHEFVDGYVRRLARWAQGPVPWFYAVERGGREGAWHLHALVAGTSGLTTGQLEAAWKHGQTRVLRYDPARGATYYVAKAVLDDAAWYDVSRRLPPRRHAA